MDPVTHAASGAVAMLALNNRPATLWSLPVAALVCASPDLDLLFIHSPLEFLQLHRGISHSLAGSPFFGLLLALLAYPLWRKSTPDHWKFSAVWLFCTLMILLHIWLDIVTTYGTMVFLPFSHYRVRLNSIYIIDLLVTLPLLWAIWRWRFRRKLILAVLIWTFVYPASGIIINAWHTAQWKKNLAENNVNVKKLVVLPDAFSPFFWRVLYEEQTDSDAKVIVQSINALGNAREEAINETAAAPDMIQQISAASQAGETYFQFALLPVMKELPLAFAPTPAKPDSSLMLFYDLRFGSGLQFVRELLALRPNADIPFQFMAEFTPAASNQNPDTKAALEQIRLLFSDSGRDSQWHKPFPPRKPDFWQWLVGIN